MSEYAVRASHLGKQYRIGEAANLIDRIGLLRRVRGRGAAPSQTTFWALDDISFDIQQGEAVGIIGRNGAGKSTLLKVLSRITEPTRGQASIHGRLASLLEVGTGFHPELTGRENIYMNGSILGMRRAEIARAFDEIVAFADIEKFVDTPVKRYSSGMYVRLAFSVAAHLEPEILIIDEVLAVGDVQFQKKCLGKMDTVRRSGRTVLFVSHNMTAVRELTTRCILLKHGNVLFDGPPERAIELYADAAGAGFEQGADLARWPRAPLNLTRAVSFESLAFGRHKVVFDPEETIEIDVAAKARDRADAVRVQGIVFDSEGVAIGSFFSADAHDLRAGETRTFRVLLEQIGLAPGHYCFGVRLVRGNELEGHIDHDALLDVLPFEVTGVKGEGGTLGAWPRSWGPIRFVPPRMLATADGR
jgi:lipopolysaccharide transport system ATP-binding protein